MTTKKKKSSPRLPKRDEVVALVLDRLSSQGVDDVTIKLGGDTSFDIYPEGWDKTYALKHFPESQWDCFFVGDRCNPTGNDYEIFEHLNAQERAFETSGPEETIEIIDIHLHKLLGALDDNS